MKFTLKPAMLPWLTLGLGGLGLALRSWLYATGIDGKGLLSASHPANYLIWLLTVAAVVILALCLRFDLPGGTYQKLFPRSAATLVGCCIGALGIVVSSIVELTALEKPDYAAVAALVAGILAGASLVYLGLCRLKGIHPSVLFRAVVCVYFMLHLVSQYRNWSSEPQLQEYFFQLMASVLLMMCAYHRAAMDADKHLLRRYLFTHQLGLFFCCTAMVGHNRLFYLAMAIWTLLDDCAIVSVQRPGRELE